MGDSIYKGTVKYNTIIHLVHLTPGHIGLGYDEYNTIHKGMFMVECLCQLLQDSDNARKMNVIMFKNSL